MRSTRLTVIDFFCGAGGFSEGFRQQGFKVVMGVDNWRPAVDTHNLNHGLKDEPRDILELQSIEAIERLPDTDIIVGSPPCVLFSMSNRAGKADKTLGIQLIETYFKIIAVKKHKRRSKLKAWFFENVPNSRKYLKPHYTFRDLQLSEWAVAIGKDADDVAIAIEGNGGILNAAEYGAPQRRERFVCGEIVKTGTFPRPEKTHGSGKLPFVALRDIRSTMPSPIRRPSKKTWIDPNYPGLKVRSDEIADHFYDPGIYEVQWRHAKYMKVNHPFMGKMSFPEDESMPSRTIMATRSTNTREALIYKSEYRRKGDGEYRSPTLREIACLMGFPYTYHFVGKETTKWAQIGNAVCPPMSAAIAKTVRKELGLRPVGTPSFSVSKVGGVEGLLNFNTFAKREFNNPPKRKPHAKFRKHPFKDGNITVALMNFNPEKPQQSAHGNKWYAAVFRGTGEGFWLRVLPKNKHQEIERIILSEYKSVGRKFIDEFEKQFSHVIGRAKELQIAYEGQVGHSSEMEPTRLIDEIAALIEQHDPGRELSQISPYFTGTKAVPVRQLMAMYAINRLIS